MRLRRFARDLDHGQGSDTPGRRADGRTLDHVLDGLRLEGNLLSHLDGLALRGHEGDEFVAHGARVFCVSRTKEETSGGTTRALATVRLVDVEFPRHLTSSNIMHGCFQFGGFSTRPTCP